MPLQQIRHFAPALFALIAFSSLVPESVAAATPQAAQQDATHPVVMQQAASSVATATTPALQPFTSAPLLPATANTANQPREVFGFALASSLADPTVGYPTWNFSVLTTIAFFGLHVQDDGTFAADSGWNVWNSSQLTGLLTTAHSSGTKVVLTIILQDFSSGTPHMCSGLRHYATTVAATVAEVKAKGVDGVNVDYEGLNGSCGSADPSWARHDLNNFMGSLRAGLPAGSYLSVDTYASSAADPIGFFDVTGLAPSVDSFFVMAYDLEYSNYARAPTSCSSFCLGPTAPLSGYYYNDTTTASQYATAVPSSKVILGVPYYGRKGCVAAVATNAYPTSSVVADSYLDASGESTASMVQAGSYATHRDTNDPTGQERWDTWVNTTLNCTRELYWDDTVSLAQKYALVNQDNLRGVGIWNLNYGGGAPELWSTLSTYFACPVSVTVPASEATTEFSVGLSAGSCTAASSFELQQQDVTLNQGWSPLKSTPPTSGSASAVAQSFQGDSYQFRARAHSATGVTGTWSMASTSVPATATLSHPFKGLYTLDAYGGVSPDSSLQLTGSAYWPGWKIARVARALPGTLPQSGAVLDGYGGLHPYGVPVSLSITASWPGWDIARDFAFLPDGSGGYVLDGYGGLHPFSVNGHALPAAARTTASWPGWDIARKVVIFSDGTGGYVMDGYGGLHPFGIGVAPPPNATGAAYWQGWQIARDVVLIPGSHMGYVLDGYGGLHPFNGAGPLSSNVSWPGWDIARSVWLLPGATPAVPGGYVLDGYGGPHPFDGAPTLASYPYWPGQDIARNLTGF
jgi:spore germination protein YaaH